nr:PREDICTED: kelch-like protein 20 isoform X2 [Anolis carolinensis]|eukprot:XP_008121938.1 PREDICTED: kelch-like protein 20 isoform X2 [Anolis carolinensis]
MRSKRSKVGLAVANGYLLAIGGYDGIVHVTTVEAFDWEMNKWRRFGNMQTVHPGGGVTAVKMSPSDLDFYDSPWSR